MLEKNHQRQEGSISRKLLITGGGLIAILAVSLLVWLGIDAAGREAERYETAFATWNEQTKPELVKATSSLPKDIYVFADQSTKKNLAVQKKGCDRTEQTLGKVSDAAESAPKLKGSLFGSFSGSYGEAKKRAGTRSKTIQKYLDTAKNTYQQILTDCRWNIKTNTAARDSEDLYDLLDKKYDQNYGERQGGSTCNSQSGCIPEDDAKRKKYLSVFRQATQSSIDKILPQLEPGQCGQTSFGEGCQKLHDGYKAVFDANLHYVKVANKLNSVIDSRQITDALKVYDKADTALDKAMLAAFKKQYPDFAVSKRVKNNASQSDGWLDAVAHARIDSLVKAQADIKKL